MKGIINMGIQELVEKKFGKEAWENIMSIAGCEEPFFAPSQDYPDELTVELIKAASEVSDLPMETVMLEYGKFMVLNTLKEKYASYYAVAGSTAKEFLLNMDRIHEQVTRSVVDSTPPRFDYEELPDGRLLMHYKSKRGLCVVLRGLILGIGLLFNQELQVKEVSCIRKGAPHCTMEVTFP